MYNYLVFDLDGTLAPPGRKCPESAVQLLCSLEQEGYTVILCSGKPVYYLCGFARQLGLLRPVLVGETGAVVAFGIDLPFRKVCYLPVSEEAKSNLKILKNEIDLACSGDVWYQPNEVALTPFPKSPQAFERIARILDSHPEMNRSLKIYRQFDCFDILPAEVSKEAGLQLLASLLSAEAHRFLAVGDGQNDLSMFAFAGRSVSVGEDPHVRKAADLHFETITEALLHIKEHKM